MSSTIQLHIHSKIERVDEGSVVEAPGYIAIAVGITAIINSLLAWLFKTRDSGKAEQSVSARIDAAFGRVEEMERNRVEMENVRKEMQLFRDRRDDERWSRMDKRMEILEGWIRPGRTGGD